MDAPRDVSPYVGLQPYTAEDRDYFFGREEDQETVAANLLTARLVILYGASGVGKTSVLQAGVVPYLVQTPAVIAVVFRTWQRADFLPALKHEVVQATGRHAGDASWTEALLERAARAGQPRSLAAVPLDDLLAGAARAADGTLTLILDQFEEYFLYHPDGEADNPFEAELARAVNRTGIETNVLLAMREDSLALLDRFQGRIPNLWSTYLRLDHLDRAAAERAIRRPLDRWNERVPSSPHMAVDDDLVAAIVEDVRIGRVTLGQAGQGALLDEPAAGEAPARVRIETPFLQMVLERLWTAERAAGSDRLRLTTYEAEGRARQIVQAHLDGVMDGLTPEEQAVCARFFDRLVTPSGTKIAYSTDDLLRFAGVHATDVQATDGDAAGERRVRAMLDGLTDSRILRGVAARGERGGAQGYEIAHDVLAPAILRWQARYTQQQRERAAAEQRTREQAEAERQLAYERGRVRSRNILLGVLAVLLLVITGLSLVTIRQYRQAEEQRQAADELRGIAEEQSRIAKEQAAIATSRELASSATGQLPLNAELGLLLAAEAWRTARTPQAEDILRQAAMESRVRAVLRGSTRPLWTASFSPDGSVAVTAGGESTARLWDVATGALVHELTGHTADVTGTAFSPDGTRLVTGSVDRTARVWDVATGDTRAVLSGHTHWVLSASFSPDGRRVVTASTDGTARVWDAETGAAVSVLSGHTGRVTAAAFSPDGRRVVTANGYILFDNNAVEYGGNDGTARVWDAVTGELILTLRGQTPNISAVAYSPDGRFIVIGDTSTARVYDATTGSPVSDLNGHTSVLFRIVFSPGGGRIVTASGDGTARLWETATGKTLSVLSGHAGVVFDAAFSPDGRRVVTAGGEGAARVWDAATGRNLATLSGHRAMVVAAAFSRDGQRIITADREGVARLWDVRTDQRVATLEGHQLALNSVGFSSDGTRLVTASNDGRAILWETSSGVKLNTLFGHIQPVRSASFSPDGATVVTAGGDSVALVWDAATGQILTRLTGHTAAVTGAAYSPDARMIVTASGDKTARVWNPATGEQIARLEGHTAPLTDAAFSPDSRRIVTAGADGAGRVWDVDTGATVATLSGHAGEVTAAAFSPDGRLVVTAGVDGTARVWDVATETMLVTLVGHTAAVRDAAFSADGKYVITASDDATARVWDAATGKLVAMLHGHKSAVTGARFSPDGAFVATASADGTARVSPREMFAPIDEVVALIPSRVTREFSPEERRTYLREP